MEEHIMRTWTTNLSLWINKSWETWYVLFILIWKHFLQLLQLLNVQFLWPH